MINVGYGPISMALDLANQSGKGKYNQTQYGNDVEFANLMGRAQDAADRRRATDIQAVLQYNEMGDKNNQFQSRANTEQREQNDTNAYRNSSLGLQKQELGLRTAAQQNETSYRTGMLGVAQQKANTSEDRAATYQQHIDNLAEYHKNHQSMTNELGAYHAQVKAANEELKSLQDPLLSRSFGPTKRDDVDDKTWGAALAKVQAAEAQRDAKIGEVIAHSHATPAAPQDDPNVTPGLPPIENLPVDNPPRSAAPMPSQPGALGQAMQGGAQPGMPGQQMQAQPATPELLQQVFERAINEIGVRPAIVDSYPPPSMTAAANAKDMAMQKSSDPTEQRLEFYRLLIGVRMDPRKQPQPTPVPPGSKVLNLGPG